MLTLAIHLPIIRRDREHRAGVVLSAASHFTSYHPSVAAGKDGGGVLSMSGIPKMAPAGSPFSTLLVARPHLTRAYQAWGSFQRQLHNTARTRGSGVSQLSYWDDNQASGRKSPLATKNLLEDTDGLRRPP